MYLDIVYNESYQVVTMSAKLLQNTNNQLGNTQLH